MRKFPLTLLSRFRTNYIMNMVTGRNNDRNIEDRISNLGLTGVTKSVRMTNEIPAGTLLKPGMSLKLEKAEGMSYVSIIVLTSVKIEDSITGPTTDWAISRISQLGQEGTNYRGVVWLTYVGEEKQLSQKMTVTAIVDIFTLKLKIPQEVT